MDNLGRIKNYIPDIFWQHREYFFYEGMDLKIGKLLEDYGPSDARKAATETYAANVRLGREESLEGYVAGDPFPNVSPDDLNAGIKQAWNIVYHHDAMEGKADFYFSYWAKGGEQLPIHFKGEGWGLRLARRTDRLENGGFVFSREKRMGAGGVLVSDPFDYRGIKVLGYRYLDWEGPPSEAKDGDAWAYIPDLRRVRRFSRAQRQDAIAGTDFTLEDFGSFQGVPPEYHWKHLGTTQLIAPVDSQAKGYPFDENANFGPTGFSLANDVWDLRPVYVIEFEPKSENHPYSRKTLWVDAQTHWPLYSAAYDRKGQLWKLMYHVRRWSESPTQPDPIAGQRTFFPLCDVLVNAKTGTGNRIEIWNARATQLSKKKIRRMTDVGRLSQGTR